MVATKTNGKAKSSPETHGLLIETAQLLAEPLDLEQLAADGVIRKRRGGWYEITDPDRLPDHARSKIKSVKSGNRVKFRKASKRARRFLKSLEAAAQPA